MSRQSDRTQLRPVGEFISAKILPGLPRRLRRLMGRAYGNAAYRQINELDRALYSGDDHGYTKFQLSPEVTKWVAREGKKLLEPVPELPEATNVEIG